MYEIMKTYEELKRKNPNIDTEMVHHFAKNMPYQFETVINEYEYGCHLMSEDMYNKAVACFENPDGTKGAHWEVDTIKQKSGIDFDNKDYTLLDYAYSVNMSYSDRGDLLSQDNVFKDGKRYLEDKDYYGEPSERAYKDAKKRIKYFYDNE
jgi:hypothetical protein